jgi:hypothetical protein
MCACTETDVRESANNCTLASGEGHGSCGETFHPFCAASPVSSSVEHYVTQWDWNILPFFLIIAEVEYAQPFVEHCYIDLVFGWILEVSEVCIGEIQWKQYSILGKCKLGFVVVQAVRWENCDYEQADHKKCKWDC